MNTPAVTRLSAPRPLAGVIVRHQLVDRILAPGKALVVASGPAGSGKSTVLAQAYAASSGGAWVSASQRDMDAAVFWSAVIDSAALVLPGFGDDYRSRLDVVGASAVDDIVPLVVNELVLADQPIRFFLDDVHLLTGAHTRRSLAQFVELLPPHVVVVLAGRGRSPIPVGRHRLRDGLVEIGPHELAMDADEAAAMLDARGLTVDSTQLSALVERTEGWAAGIAWAAIAVDRRGDTEHDLTASLTATPGEIANYLIEEVIDHLPVDEREFMLATSILRRFSADLCDALLDRDDSSTMLKSLGDSNSFLLALDQKGEWFRYHHLVHEVLAAQLERERPTELVALHRRAAKWHREHGDVVAAVRHSLEAGEPVAAADVVCANWWDMVGKGRGDTLEGLFDRLGPELVRSHQPLTIAAAEYYATAGNRALSRQYYDAAKAGRFEGSPPDGTSCIESTLALMKGAIVYEGVAQSLVDARLAYELEGPATPWRIVAALLVGLGTTWQGDSAEAAPYFEEVVASRPPDTASIVYALAETALADLARGDLVSATSSAERSCELVEANGLEDLFLSGTAYAALSLVGVASGDHQRAAESLRKAVRPMLRGARAFPVDTMRTRLLLADAALELGYVELAAEHLEHAEVIDLEIADTGVLSGRLAAARSLLATMRSAGTGTIALSERERQVLDLLPSELTVREIGAELFLSRNTIKTHIRRIYREFDVSSRNDVVARAREKGFLSEG